MISIAKNKEMWLKFYKIYRLDGEGYLGIDSVYEDACVFDYEFDLLEDVGFTQNQTLYLINAINIIRSSSYSMKSAFEEIEKGGSKNSSKNKKSTSNKKSSSKLSNGRILEIEKVLSNTKSGSSNDVDRHHPILVLAEMLSSDKPIYRRLVSCIATAEEKVGLTEGPKCQGHLDKSFNKKRNKK